jgi:hypothetical protein
MDLVRAVDRPAERYQVLVRAGYQPGAPAMILQQESKLVGYVDLDLGRRAIRVPVQSVEPGADGAGEAPLVSFEFEDGLVEIVVRGDMNSAGVGREFEQAVEAAVRHLSAKLLN